MNYFLCLRTKWMKPSPPHSCTSTDTCLLGWTSISSTSVKNRFSHPSFSTASPHSPPDPSPCRKSASYWLMTWDFQLQATAGRQNGQMGQNTVLTKHLFVFRAWVHVSAQVKLFEQMFIPLLFFFDLDSSEERSNTCKEMKKREWQHAEEEWGKKFKKTK